jgi:hypothetical protein
MSQKILRKIEKEIEKSEKKKEDKKMSNYESGFIHALLTCKENFKLMKDYDINFLISEEKDFSFSHGYTDGILLFNGWLKENSI